MSEGPYSYDEARREIVGPSFKQPFVVEDKPAEEIDVLVDEFNAAYREGAESVRFQRRRLWEFLRDMGWVSINPTTGRPTDELDPVSSAIRAMENLKKALSAKDEQISRLAAEVDELRSGQAYHDCWEVIDGHTPVLANEEDGFDPSAEVLMYLRVFRDRGDPDVGMPPRQYLCPAKCEGPKFSWFDQVVGGLEVPVPEDVRRLAIHVLARYEVQRAMRIRTDCGQSNEGEETNVLLDVQEILHDSAGDFRDEVLDVAKEYLMPTRGSCEAPTPVDLHERINRHGKVVEDLEERVERLESRFEKLDSQVDRVERTANSVERDVSDLRGDVRDLERGRR